MVGKHGQGKAANEFQRRNEHGLDTHMINLIFLLLFLLMGNYPVKADEAIGSEQDFKSALDQIRNPFESALPKDIIMPEPVLPTTQVHKIIKLKPVPPPPIQLPSLKLEGVVVGDEIHQAIINDKIVPLQGVIEGARVISVTQDGVGLLFKRKKFFLKVD